MGRGGVGCRGRGGVGGVDKLPQITGQHNVSDIRFSIEPDLSVVSVVACFGISLRILVCALK